MHTILLPKQSFSTPFYMIRHGQTVANAEGYAAGHLDTPLTPKGKEQARDAAKSLAQLSPPPDYIVHSPLMRAKDTANILNQTLQLPTYSEAQLMEQHFGTWQQQAWATLHPRIAAGEHPPEGESYPDFYTRALKGIQQALNFTEGMPLLVTHGGVFDAVWDAFTLPKIDVENTEFYFFTPQD